MATPEAVKVAPGNCGPKSAIGMVDLGLDLVRLFLRLGGFNESAHDPCPTQRLVASIRFEQFGNQRVIHPAVFPIALTLRFVVEKKAAGKLTYVEEERNPDSTM